MWVISETLNILFSANWIPQSCQTKIALMQTMSIMSTDIYSLSTAIRLLESPRPLQTNLIGATRGIHNVLEISYTSPEISLEILKSHFEIVKLLESSWNHWNLLESIHMGLSSFWIVPLVDEKRPVLWRKVRHPNLDELGLFSYSNGIIVEIPAVTFQLMLGLNNYGFNQAV